jgi:hypothetical protein
LSLAVVASLTFASAPAFAQPPGGVQPVPYAPSQPVPYAAPGVVPPPTTTMAPGVSGGDVVTLKGGGMIRGTLLEEIPNDHATVQLVTGQTAMIPWERIEHIDRASASGSGGVSRAPRANASTAWVHIESDRPVRLEREGEGHARGSEWETICASPCDAEVPLGSDVRIGGEGIRTSRPFHLNAAPGERVELVVNAGTRGGFVGGIILTSVGPIVSLIGAVVLVAASEQNQLDSLVVDGVAQQNTTTTNTTGAKTVGVVLVIGGIALTIGGILMLTGNARTHVQEGPLSVTPRPQDAWLRAPTWREDHTAEALPKTFDVPLFHTSF